MPASSSSPCVAIVGGGIAGLAAAAELAAAGIAVELLEARDRFGGRIDTRHDFASSPVELGAEFVHGRHPGLVRWIRDADLHLVERRFEPLMLQDGKASSVASSWEKIFTELANPAARDEPIAERAAELLRRGEWNESDAQRLRRYVEGYMAADFDRASAMALSHETRASEAIGEDGNATIREGYDALVSHMAARARGAGASLQLRNVVRRIAWRRGHVGIDVDAGGDRRQVVAACIVVTVPLGFLQAPDTGDALRFDPDIPEVVAAARRLAMGNVVKLFLRLRAPLSSLPGLDPALASALARSRFLQTPAGPVPTWWRRDEAAPPGAARSDAFPDGPRTHAGEQMLVGWCGGAAADRLAGLSAPAVADAGIDTLAGALAVPRDAVAALVDAQTVADWSAEEWSRGAYSWIPAGGVGAASVLATPVEDTLFFAGEATDTAGYRGTVHGALETGVRAARQVLASL